MNKNTNEFLSVLRDAFLAPSSSPIDYYLKINDIIVKFTFFEPSLADIMIRPFQHLLKKIQAEVHFTILVGDGSNPELKQVISNICNFSTDDCINENFYFNQGSTHFLHNTITKITSVVDLNSSQAFYYIDLPLTMPDYEKAAPFRMVFHWICQKYNMNMIHGAVIGIGNSGYLLAGKGGSGKSTMSVLSFLNNHNLLGDDYIITDNQSPPNAFSLYNSIKVNPDIIHKLPYLDHYIANRDNENYDKGFLFADELPKLNMKLSLPLNGIIMMTGEKSEKPHICKTHPIKALSVIGSSTVLQMPGINKDFLKRISGLISTLPVFEFLLGNSINGNLKTLEDFIDDNPVISVIIPVYNGSQHVKSAILSVLEQTYNNIELIIVDDGSTDNTKDICYEIDDSRLRYIYQENQGPGPARNNGIIHSLGRYVSFIDHDDIWYKDKIEKQFSYIKQNPEFKVIYCKHNLKLMGSESLYPWLQKIDGELRYAYEIPSSMFLHRSIFDRVGLFNKKYNTAEDSDLHLRIKDIGIGMTTMDDFLFDKYIHGGNISKDIQSNRRNLSLILADSIRRKHFLENYKISVIIPAYNPDEHLNTCIKSIFSQTLQPHEIIIVDDGSENDVKGLLNDINDDRIKIFRQDNKGISGARNLGIMNSSGNVLAFIDSDDLWSEDKLELQMERLVADSTIHAVFGYIRQFYSPEVDFEYRKKYYFNDKMTKGIIPGTMLIKKDIFMQVGLFNEEIRLGELFDWIHRFSKLDFKYTLIPDIVMYRRLHYNNNGIINKTDRIDFAKVFANIVKDKKNGKT